MHFATIKYNYDGLADDWQLYPKVVCAIFQLQKCYVTLMNMETPYAQSIAIWLYDGIIETRECLKRKQ